MPRSMTIVKLLTPEENMSPAPKCFPELNTEPYSVSRNGWVSKKGVFLACGHFGHDDLAEEIAERHHGGFVSRSYSDTAAQYIEGRGWIRVSACSPFIPDHTYKNDDHVWRIPEIQYAALWQHREHWYPGTAGAEFSSFGFMPY